MTWSVSSDGGYLAVIDSGIYSDGPLMPAGPAAAVPVRRAGCGLEHSIYPITDEAAGTLTRSRSQSQSQTLVTCITDAAHLPHRMFKCTRRLLNKLLKRR